MEIDIGQNTTDMLSGLATQLNMSVETVFPYYVNAARMEAIIAVIVLLVVTFATIKGVKYAIKKLGNDPLVVILMMVASFVLMVVAVELPSQLTTAVHPEAHAIGHMIDDASKLLGGQ